ncbi:MAG TPA: hypothetical protein VFQ35_11760 [Polyangiaceae bacterium]|nr:hypothetical protein [Polyangiaceae bacterium]
MRLWLVLTAAILFYAWLDLRLNPRLLMETHFSMRPDLDQLPDLMHWGGRLLNHRALSLLVGNALVLGGVGALFGRGIVRFVQRVREREASVSIVPSPPPTSVPPAPR